MRGTWDDLNRRLTGAILALDLDDSLVIADKVPQPKRRFGKKPAAVPRRYVQITSARHALIGECVGSTSFGGDWEMTPEVEATLLKQGWEKPWSAEYRTFQREMPLVGAPNLALASVLALQALGCTMEDLDVELLHEESGE